jgi:thiamine-monophosphate kinase
LLLAVPPAQESALHAAAARAGVAVSRIGAFRSGAPEVIVRDGAGAVMKLARGGWSHF